MESGNKLKNRDFPLISYVGLLTNLILIISSYWFSYNSISNFHIEILGLTFLLSLGLFIRKFRNFSLAIMFIYYIYFIIFNYNYIFLFGISIIFGLMITNFLKPQITIPSFVYSLIPLLLLGHIIWFNLLPFGFADEFRVDVGSRKDELKNVDIYIEDPQDVLSPSQSYGEQKWRSFEKDGTFSIGFNTPIDLDNKTVEVTIKYEATGPLYVNGELFYDPKWGSSANIGPFKEEYLYGADKFNLSLLYEDVPMNKFLALTGESSIESYILKTYGVNLVPHNDSYVGTVDLWIEREKIKKTKDLSVLTKSKFYNPEKSKIIDELSEENSNNNVEEINQVLISPLEAFLQERNQTLQEFIDHELNYGPYPNKRTFNGTGYETLEDYIRTKFPDGVLVKDFTGNYPELEKEMNTKFYESINSIDYYENWSDEPEKIEMQFRGETNFYGVFNNSINFSVLKQDLNLYNGSDNVTITIKDYEDNIIKTLQIPDNDKEDTRTTDASEWKNYSFYYPLVKPGIYQIEFDHTYPSQDPDYVIGDLTLNSNKVMIDGDFMLWSPGRLYNNQDMNTLSTRYWWEGYDQTISFENGTTYELDDELKGEWVEIDITKNEFFSFDKGRVIVSAQNDLALFPNTEIGADTANTLKITKSYDLKNENIKFVNIDGLNISGTEGTKISQIKIKIS